MRNEVVEEFASALKPHQSIPYLSDELNFAVVSTVVDACALMGALS